MTARGLLGGLGLAALFIGLGVHAVRGGMTSVPVSRVPTVKRPSLTWIGEPQAGFRPWASALRHVKTGVEVNAYLLTDTAYANALKQIAHRGIPVHVILAANPYHDAAAVATERHLFAGSRVQWQWAPPRFDQDYATDHAKYLVVNPGSPHAVALLGSPNGTGSAFGGWNAEDAVETTEPAMTTALTQVFRADWTHTPAGTAPRQTLVLSPGAQSTLGALLTGSGPVAVTAEELGDVPALYAALAAHGPRGRLLVPTDALQSVEARQYATTLVRVGVHIRTLTTPYLHAKLIVTIHQTWVGSQNWSEPSMQNNREVGVLTRNATIHAQALTWFNQLWSHAVSWPRTLRDQSSR